MVAISFVRLLPRWPLSREAGLSLFTPNHMENLKMKHHPAWLAAGLLVFVVLACNLGKWIAQLALPSEAVRWEWKRFRRHFRTVD